MYVRSILNLPTTFLLPLEKHWKITGRLIRSVTGLGWLWFLCSAHLAWLLSPFCLLSSALAEAGRRWNRQNQSQPNSVTNLMSHPVYICPQNWSVSISCISLKTTDLLSFADSAISSDDTVRTSPAWPPTPWRTSSAASRTSHRRTPRSRQTCSAPSGKIFAVVVRSLKFGNVWAFVQLI